MIWRSRIETTYIHKTVAYSLRQEDEIIVRMNPEPNPNSALAGGTKECGIKRVMF